MLTQAEHVANGGNACPNCGANDFGCNPVEIEGARAMQICTCIHCHYSWEDIYLLQGFAIDEHPGPDYEAIAIERGFRLAQNTVVNVGYYWRPNDNMNWSPTQVFGTAFEAWRDCCIQHQFVKEGEG